MDSNKEEQKKKEIREKILSSLLKKNDSGEKAKKILAEQIGYEREKNKFEDHVFLYSVVKDGKFNPEKEIVCYAGAPGTGKTTFVQKLNQAMGRGELQIIAFAGLKEFKDYSILGDEKKPSLVARAIEKSGCKNPIILLDELEKVSEGEKIQKDLVELFKKYKGESREHDPQMDKLFEQVENETNDLKEWKEGNKYYDEVHQKLKLNNEKLSLGKKIEDLKERVEEKLKEPEQSEQELKDKEERKKIEKEKTIFRDKYYRVNIELDHITFFATVNYPEQLAPSFKNEVEMRKVEDYSDDEKKKILESEKEKIEAKIKEIYPEQKKEIIPKEIIQELPKYIKEKGIRQSERVLYKIMKKYINCPEEERKNFSLGDPKEWLKENVLPYKESFYPHLKHYFLLFPLWAIIWILSLIVIIKKIILRNEDEQKLIENEYDNE